MKKPRKRVYVAESVSEEENSELLQQSNDSNEADRNNEGGMDKKLLDRFFKWDGAARRTT